MKLETSQHIGPTIPLRRAVTAALAAVGAAALGVQVTLLRELLTEWHGNEMSLGVVLSVWLLTGGAGAAAYGLARRLARARRPGRHFPAPAVLARGIVALGVLAPLTLFVARAARAVMNLDPTELVGFMPLVAATFASVAPFAFLAGFLFSAATAVLADVSERGSGAAGRIYVAEAAGAAASGLVISLVLLPRVNPVAVTLIATAVTSAAGAAVLLAGGPSSARKSPAALSIATVTLVGAVWIAAGPSARLDDASVAARWTEMGFLSQTNSKYGRIVATRMGSQVSLYENGTLVASSPDRLRAEETVHLPMLEHPEPAHVLLLGGGLGGSIEELLKYGSVRSVDYVELDPAIIDAARSAAPGSMLAGFDDPRVHVHFGDARFFIKHARPEYDVVILAVPDPETAQLNRFYTLEAMREVRRVLRDGGVVGLTLSSTENYISEEQADLLSCVAATMNRAFPAVIVLPGDPCHFIGSLSSAFLTSDPDVLAERVLRRGLDVVFIRDYYLEDRLSPERTQQLDEAVSSRTPRIDTDLSPVLYYLDLVVWQSRVGGGSRALARAGRLIRWPTAAAAAALLLAVTGLPALRRRRRGGAFSGGVFVAVFVVGATEITLELAALLSFQSIYGYVYRQLALIVAGFMAGLAVGGWLGTVLSRRRAGFGVFAALQAAIAALPIFLGLALSAIAGLPPSPLASWAIYFPLLVVGSAMLAGMQFPLAVRLVSSYRTDAGSIAGRLYAADLVGAAAGAPLSSILLLPLLGIPGTMLAFAALNVALVPCLLLSTGPRGIDQAPAMQRAPL